MKLSNDLGNDSILNLVFKLAIPTIFAQLINLLYSIVDRMYIGHIPEIGSMALAGVGVCGPITTFLSSFGTLVGIGGSILMSIRMGEGKNKKAQHILANSFFALSVIGVVLTIIFLILKNKLIMLFGASPVTFPYANKYLTIYTLGTFFALMAVGLNFFIACQGFPMVSMFTVIIGAITNIVLDTIFIFKLEMGVTGAAWATVIAQTLSFIFAFKFLRGKKTKIAIVFRSYSFRIIKNIVKFGFSPFFITTTDSIILIALNAMLQKYGGEGQGDLLISGAAIVQSYILLITGPLLGLTGGTQPLLSFNYGAKKIDRVKKAEKYILIFALTMTTTMFLSTKFISQHFISYFTDDEILKDIAYNGIRASLWGIIALSFQYCFVDCFTAVGRIKTAFGLSMFRKTTYVIGVCILPIFFGAKSAFLAQSVSDFAGATMCIIVFSSIFNKHLERRLKQN
ncbi:MATE family efflux transporter [Fusobacterium sp.]|uniref:MATE family efflux transporter n=1 Tax=Fusobacterium sp. TaxID=68766 RepID=UPI00260B36FB|nr:MATE family efflux transporter [Fusobacterium sp.]